jgi:hypothetical protein
MYILVQCSFQNAAEDATREEEEKQNPRRFVKGAREN